MFCLFLRQPGILLHNAPEMQKQVSNLYFSLIHYSLTLSLWTHACVITLENVADDNCDWSTEVLDPYPYIIYCLFLLLKEELEHGVWVLCCAKHNIC